MSERNGQPLSGKSLSLEDLRQQEEIQRTRARTARARIQADLYESLGNTTGGFGFNPGWADLIDPFYARRDDFGRLWLPLGAGGLHGHQGGRNRPFVWTDLDLDRIRSLAQWLATRNDLAIGAIGRLADYTVRTGFEYEVRPGRHSVGDSVAHKLAALAQRVIEEFRSLNTVGEDLELGDPCDPGCGVEQYSWVQRERQAVVRAVRDGEVFVRTFDQGDGTTLVRFAGPEQIRQPAGTGDNVAFGVESPPGDVESVLAYHYTEDGHEFERVPPSQMAHLKLNVDTCVKRGLSDFYSSGDAFDGVNRLLRNMRETGAVQSAIAWIEQFDGVSGTGISGNIAAVKDLNRPQFQHPISGRSINYQRYDPGSILKVTKGRQYLAAPLASNTSNHTSIVQACLRAAGARWGMPEYMISGDSSNANYASTLVSGAPFVTAVECRQKTEFGPFFVRILWQALRNAARAGRFRLDGHCYSFRELSRLLDIEFTPPAVAIANEQEQANIDHQDIQARVLSLQTRRARRGLDTETERRNLKEEPPPGMQASQDAGAGLDLDPEKAGGEGGEDGATPAPAGQGGGQGAGQSAGEQAQAAAASGDLRTTVGGMQGLKDLQTAVYGGQLPRLAAIANAMLMLGFSQEEAERLFPEVPAKNLQDDGQDQGQGGGLAGGPGGAGPGAGGNPLAGTLGEGWQEWHPLDLGWVLQEGEKRQKGVPFQGPSGRWFVVNDAGRTVPSKNPNADKGGSKDGGTGKGKAEGRGGGKEPRPKIEKPTVEGARQHIEGMLKAGKTTPEDRAALTEYLMGLTTKDHAELNRHFAARAGSGKKAEVAAKLAEKILGKGAKEKPPTPEPKPEPKATGPTEADRKKAAEALRAGGYEAFDPWAEDWDKMSTGLRDRFAGVFERAGLTDLASLVRGKKVQPTARGLGASTIKALSAHSRQVGSKMSAAEKAALHDYTGGEYRDINGHLWGVELPPDRKGKAAKQVEELDRTFARAGKLPEPVTVYRSIGDVSEMDPKQIAAIWKDLEAAHKAGKEVEMKGYSSTSTETTPLNAPEESVNLEIRTSRGLLINPLVPDNVAMGEDELLLPRGMKFKVVGFKTVTDDQGRKFKVAQLEEVEGGSGAGGEPPQPEPPKDRPQPKPPGPGFTGVDSLGRHWVNGKLVPGKEEPRDTAGKRSRKFTTQELRKLKGALTGDVAAELAERVVDRLGSMSDEHALHAWRNTTRYQYGVKHFEPRTAGEVAEAVRHIVQYHTFMRAEIPAGQERAAAIKAFPPLSQVGERLNIHDLRSKEARTNIYHLSLMSESLSKALVEHGLQGYYVGSEPITGLDSKQDLKGVQPRGWGEGDTWDQVAGGYDRDQQIVLAGKGRSASQSLMLHEAGHGVGHLLGWNDAPELLEHHRRLYDKLGGYFRQGGPGGYSGTSELLAESLAIYHVKGRDWAAAHYDEPFVVWLEQGPLSGKHARENDASATAGKR